MFLISTFMFCVILLWWFLNDILDYWKKKNVPFISSNVWTELITKFRDSVPYVDKYRKVYNELDGQPFGGCFQEFKPQFFVRDPDLIQKILCSDFDYFRDRGNVRYVEHDPLTNQLFSAPGSLWKKLRVRLTPTFTSGKIKYMFDLVKECAEEYQETFLKQATAGKSFDVKDYTVNYAIEVIGSTAFGLKTHSMNSDSEFKKMSRYMFQARLSSRMRFMVHDWFPSLQKFLRLRVLDSKVCDFFSKMVGDTVEYRKKNHFSRSDFLQILISLKEASTASNTRVNGIDIEKCKEEEELEFTNELMVAQCFLFFIAGYDTSSLILSSTLLELALHQDIQRRLHEEIDLFLEKYNDHISYEMIKEMPYLHKVVLESMRKYPVLPALSRISTKRYHIPDSNVIIDEGTEIIISTAGLHHDPNYFPNPEKYDPERFTEDAINERHKFVYLPFGGGPRNCIGSRFALISVKLGLVYALQKYRFDRTPETIYPIQYKPFKKLNDYNHTLMLKCFLRNK